MKKIMKGNKKKGESKKRETVYRKLRKKDKNNLLLKLWLKCVILKMIILR